MPRSSGWTCTLRLSTLIPMLLLCCLVQSPPVIAAEPGRVIDWGGCPVDPPPMPPGADALKDKEISVESGRAEVSLAGDATFSGQIMLRSGDRLLRADGASFNRETGTLQVTGAAEFRNDDLRVNGSDASFSERDGEIRFNNADFDVWTVPARGTAERLVVRQEGTVKMREVSYTACPPGSNDWLLRASKVTLDQETGVGKAKNARMEVKGVPVFWLPTISYPISEKRKSGFLVPDVGNSERRGFDVATPWYWNIAPNYDATITPRLMTQRGVQLGGEFRYLQPGLNGVLQGEVLKDDDKTNKNRTLLAIEHQQALPWGWRGTAEGIDVSDSNYFEDFSSSLASTSQVSLNRFVDLEFYNGPWTALFRVQDFQIIDDSLTSEEKPYKRLPQFVLNGYQPEGLLGFNYRVDSELSFFDRDVGATGLRAHITPAISRSMNFGFLRVEPGAALDHTRYALDDADTFEKDDPERTVPILSMDLSSVFERTINKGRFLQTLEPRALYTYIPSRNQDDLPVFDTIEPDLNIVQLYRPNRFVGYDRLADANQIALGLTTRMIRAETGVEFLRATVGQLRYFSDSKVTLPDVEPIDDNSSDYLAELSTKFANYWRMDLGYQWNTDETDTRKAEARVRYQRDGKRIAGLSYRYRKRLLQEIDAVLAWPLAEHWNFVGRFNFSIRGSEPLERFAALEYETCCWAVRTVWRRYLTRRNGESDTSVGFQFVLKGFGDPGTAAESLLDRGILGY
ncbi:MAG: LPS-assembly protein LptD [Gammaproteobacteria bacterium]